MADLGFARLDLDRERRQGLAEVVYAPGKTREQISAIAGNLLSWRAAPPGEFTVAVVAAGTSDGPVATEAHAVTVIAGMEGALASVVGGLVRGPVIAVPTSTGYGASFEGITALLADTR